MSTMLSRHISENISHIRHFIGNVRTLLFKYETFKDVIYLLSMKKVICQTLSWQITYYWQDPSISTLNDLSEAFKLKMGGKAYPIPLSGSSRRVVIACYPD